MGNLVLNIMERFGYIGIFFLITIENLFPPIPSEVILTFGGFLTTYTKLYPFGVIISSSFGSLLGAIILYYFGSFIKTKESDLSKTNSWFLNHGNKAVFLGRFVPIIRSLISIPAGMYKMKMKLFIIYTFLGSFAWNTLLVYAGVILGKNWPYFCNILQKYSKLVMIFIGTYLLFKLAKIIRKNCHNLTN